jgi:hypothetical protein
LDGFPSSSDEAGEIGRDGTEPLVGDEGRRIENRPEDPAVVGKDELLLASLMGDDGRVLDLTGGDEGFGSIRAPSPDKLIVGGINGGLPTEPSSGDGGKGRPLVKLLLRSRGCSQKSVDGTELEDPEGPELMASCELDALAARSEAGSGRERFQYGTNLVREGLEEVSLRRVGDPTGAMEGGFETSLAGLELLTAVSEEMPGAERGRGRGRLPLVGEVGEAEGSVEVGGWGDGRVTPELGSEPGRNERV